MYTVDFSHNHQLPCPETQHYTLADLYTAPFEPHRLQPSHPMSTTHGFVLHRAC